MSHCSAVSPCGCGAAPVTGRLDESSGHWLSGSRTCVDVHRTFTPGVEHHWVPARCHDEGQTVLGVPSVRREVAMADRSLRGTRIGAHSMESEEGVEFAERFEAYYDCPNGHTIVLSLIHISEPTRLGMISYAVFCLKKK